MIQTGTAIIGVIMAMTVVLVSKVVPLDQEKIVLTKMRLGMEHARERLDQCRDNQTSRNET